jgi:hypothetical protein
MVDETHALIIERTIVLVNLVGCHNGSIEPNRDARVMHSIVARLIRATWMLCYNTTATLLADPSSKVQVRCALIRFWRVGAMRSNDGG